MEGGQKSERRNGRREEGKKDEKVLTGKMVVSSWACFRI